MIEISRELVFAETEYLKISRELILRIKIFTRF